MRRFTKVIEEPDDDDVPLNELKIRKEKADKARESLGGRGGVKKAKPPTKKVYVRKISDLDSDEDFSGPIKITLGTPSPYQKAVQAATKVAKAAKAAKRARRKTAVLDSDSDSISLGSTDTDTDADMDHDTSFIPGEHNDTHKRIIKANISEARRKHCLSLLRTVDNDRDALNAIELILSLPQKTKGSPISLHDSYERVHNVLLNGLDCMDSQVYGHAQAKAEILEYLVARTISAETPRVLGLQGPPGVGKTSLVLNGISKALGLPFYHLSVGGLRDVTYFRGSLRCWKGSHQSIFTDILISTGCVDPIIYIDELDKVAAETAADIYGLLTHATDPLGNHSITDHYLGIDLDLSRVTFIFSFNDESVLSPPLRDRIKIVRLQGFSEADKVTIASTYIIPDLLRTLKLEGDVVFTKDVINFTNNLLLSHEPSSEALQGVRYLQRGYETIVSKILVNMVWFKRSYQALQDRHGIPTGGDGDAGGASETKVKRIMPYIKPVKWPYKPTVADIKTLLSYGPSPAR